VLCVLCVGLQTYSSLKASYHVESRRGAGKRKLTIEVLSPDTKARCAESDPRVCTHCNTNTILQHSISVLHLACESANDLLKSLLRPVVAPTCTELFLLACNGLGCNITHIDCYCSAEA